MEDAARALMHRLWLRPVYHILEDGIRAHVLLFRLGLVAISVAKSRSGERWHGVAHCRAGHP